MSVLSSQPDYPASGEDTTSSGGSTGSDAQPQGGDPGTTQKSLARSVTNCFRIWEELRGLD